MNENTEIRFITNNRKEIAEVTENYPVINKERDVLDLMGNCGTARCVLIYQKNVSTEFFDLSSGLAGIFLQKFATYSMKAAMVVNLREIKSKYFHNLVAEHSRSDFFRFYEDRQKALEWLSN